MVTKTLRLAMVLVATGALCARAVGNIELPDYRIGDLVTQDVVTPIPLSVIDPVATQTLQEKEAKQILFVVRYLPDTRAEVESKFHRTIETVRSTFLQELRQAKKGRDPAPKDVDTQPYRKALRAAGASAPKDFPFSEFTPLWINGESDNAVVAKILDPVSSMMAHPIIATRMEQALPGREPVRLVAVTNLDEAPDPKNADHGGQVTNALQLLTLPHARQLLATNFADTERNLARFASSLLRTNAFPDSQLTAEMRARRTDSLAARVEFQPAQSILKKGQKVDLLGLAALAALREKSMVTSLQTKLEVAQAKVEATQAVATRIGDQTQWVIVGICALGAGIILVLWRLRARRLTSLLPVAIRAHSGEGLSAEDANWRARALEAEQRAAKAQEAVRSGAVGLVREKVVHGLFQQRSDLLSNQQHAEAEMRALEHRLEQLHAPLQERIAAYEKRIAELEKELAVKGEQNIELIKAKISLARHQIDVERGRSTRFSIN